MFPHSQPLSSVYAHSLKFRHGNGRHYATCADKRIGIEFHNNDEPNVRTEIKFTRLSKRVCVEFFRMIQFELQAMRFQYFNCLCFRRACWNLSLNPSLGDGLTRPFPFAAIDLIESAESIFLIGSRLSQSDLWRRSGTALAFVIAALVERS